MESIWSNKQQFGEIMELSTIPYKDYMFDDPKLKQRCWVLLTKQWDVIKKYAKREYFGHPSDIQFHQATQSPEPP